jgi:hypothetical protein
VRKVRKTKYVVKRKVLCDSNVISRWLKGDIESKRLIEQIGIENILISSVVYMELQKWLWSYGGFTEKQVETFKKAISAIPLVHIDRKMSAISSGFYDNYKKTSMEVSDMLIAATALCMKVKIATMNIKDFDFINGLNLYGVSKKKK